MKPLTENQKTLLPKVREKNKAKNTKKSLVIVKLIDDYTSGKEQTRDELNAIKLAVQLYQVELKNEKLRKKEREIQSKEQRKENKDLTREKIILGACTSHIAKEKLNYPYLDFLRSWAKGFLSDRDLEFMKTRYELKEKTMNDTPRGDLLVWDLYIDNLCYRLAKSNKANNQGKVWFYQTHEKNNGEWRRIQDFYI